MEYKVQTGDTVNAIAKRFGVPRTAVSGFRSNDPNVIFPDEILSIGVPAMTPASTVGATPGISGDVPQPAAIDGSIVQKTTPQALGAQTPMPTPTNITPDGMALVAPRAPLPPVAPTLAPAPSQPLASATPGAQLGTPAPSLQPGMAPQATGAPTLPQDPQLASQYKDTLQPERTALSQYGVNPDAVEAGFQTNPFGTISSLVQQVMQATGLPDVRENLTKISDEIEELANERDEKIREIEDNPWKSASTKGTEIGQVNDRYEQKIANRTNRLTLIQNAYQQARQEAQFAATTAIGLYDKQRSFDLNVMQEMLDREEKRAEAQAKMNEPLSVAEAKSLGVPFGTTAAQAYGIQPREESQGSDLVSAILAVPRLFNNLPPSEKAKVIPQLQAQGFTFPRELSPTQMEAQVGAQSALLALGTVEQNVFNEDGTLNRKNLLKASTGFGATATARREVIDVITRIRTGAALTESEQVFYKKQVPNQTDTKDSARQKMNQLATLFAGIAGSPVTVVMPSGDAYEYSDMFDPNQRNEVRKLLTSGGTLSNF